MVRGNREESEVLIPMMRILKYQEYCEMILKKDVKDAYLVLYEHDGSCGYHEGVIEKAHSVVVELRLSRVIEVDTASRKLLRVNGEEMRAIQYNVVLDLNDEGERWEGDVLDNQPYGWGVLYDSENRMVYEGFRIGDVNVCYGRSYYAEIGVMDYEGEICEGKRWGRGALFDRNGNTVFEGEWMNNEREMEKRVVLNEENQLLHTCVEELIVGDNSCNGREWSALDLSFMSVLRLFEVSDYSFAYVKDVIMIGLKKLEKVVIGKSSFTKRKKGAGYDPDRHFILKNCNRLRELKIGQYSFSDYPLCEIENNGSLTVIKMGVLYEWNACFFYASLTLKSKRNGMK